MLGNPNEEKHGLLRGFVEAEILPSYVGSVRNHYKDPGSLFNNQDFMECHWWMFFVAQLLSDFPN